MYFKTLYVSIERLINYDFFFNIFQSFPEFSSITIEKNKKERSEKLEEFIVDCIVGHYDKEKSYYTDNFTIDFHLTEDNNRVSNIQLLKLIDTYIDNTPNIQPIIEQFFRELRLYLMESIIYKNKEYISYITP